MNSRIPCSDGVARTNEDIYNLVKDFNYTKFTYKGIIYYINFYETQLNGYVRIPEEKLIYKSSGITGSYKEPTGFYCPGFDCAHYKDIRLINPQFIENTEYVKMMHSFIRQDATFKLSAYVHTECQTMIDAYLTSIVERNNKYS